MMSGDWRPATLARISIDLTAAALDALAVHLPDPEPTPEPAMPGQLTIEELLNA